MWVGLRLWRVDREKKALGVTASLTMSQRKFSIPHVENASQGIPAELMWLLNEVGMLISKLTDLVAEISTRMTDPGFVPEVHSQASPSARNM